MVTESNDRMYALNKPVIVWRACAGMSHSSDVEPLLLPDEFPSRRFTKRGSTSPPPPPPAPPAPPLPPHPPLPPRLLSKTSIARRRGMKRRRKQGEELQRLIGQEERVREEKDDGFSIRAMRRWMCVWRSESRRIKSAKTGNVLKLPFKAPYQYFIWPRRRVETLRWSRNSSCRGNRSA